jgi:hypothetical protein
MFIVWLTRFNDVKMLKTLWIVSLVIWIVSLGIIIFAAGNTNNKVLIIPIATVGYVFTIFIGTLITFLVKNK